MERRGDTPPIPTPDEVVVLAESLPPTPALSTDQGVNQAAPPSQAPSPVTLELGPSVAEALKGIAGTREVASWWSRLVPAGAIVTAIVAIIAQARGAQEFQKELSRREREQKTQEAQHQEKQKAQEAQHQELAARTDAAFELEQTKYYFQLSQAAIVQFGTAKSLLEQEAALQQLVAMTNSVPAAHRDNWRGLLGTFSARVQEQTGPLRSLSGQEQQQVTATVERANTARRACYAAQYSSRTGERFEATEIQAANAACNATAKQHKLGDPVWPTSFKGQTIRCTCTQ